MADNDSPDPGRRKGSLLSFATGRSPDESAAKPKAAPATTGSLFAYARTPQDEPQPKTGGEAIDRDRPRDPVRPGLSSRLRDRLTEFRERRAAATALDRTVPLRDEAPPAPPPPVTRAPERESFAADGTESPYWRPLIDPVEVVSGIIAARRLILATTVLGGALGVMIALNTPKFYESTTEVLVDPRNLAIVDRELTQAGLPSDATLAIVENQVRVMTSGTVIDKVVERLGLAKDTEFNGRAGGFSIRGIIDDVKAVFAPADTGEDGANIDQAIAVGNLYDALHIERGAKTFVISVSARTRDADKSALIANTLISVYLETYGELQAGTAVRATEELTGRLDSLRADVEAAERRVEAFKAENEIIDPQGRLISDDEIVKLNDQLSVARARTIELNARAQSARGIEVDQVIDGSLPEEVASGVMTELRTQYAAQKQEADRLATRLGPRHPQRIAMDAQLSGALEQIRAELRRINSSIQVDLRRAVQLEQDLAARLAQLKVRKGDIGNELVTLRELERDASSKRAVYEAFLLRARETGEQQSLNTANVSVISTAQPALLPTGPSRSTIAIAGTLLGFLAGVGLGAALGAWRSFRNRREQPASILAREAPAASASPPPRPAASFTEPQPSAAARTSAPTDPENDTMQLVYNDDRERRPMAQAPQYPSHPAAGAYANHGQPQAYPQGQAPGWAPAWQPPMPQQGWPQPMHPQQQGWAHPQAPGQPQGQPWQQMPPQGWHPAYGWPAQTPPADAYPYPYPHPANPPQGYAPAYPAGAYPAGGAPHQQPTPSYPGRANLAVVDTPDHAPAPRTEANGAIEEIRESLREFRDAIRELTESRKTRRYF